VGNLGSFGASRMRADDDIETFEFIGEVFRLNPDNSELDELDFVLEGSNIQVEGPGADNVAATKLIKDRILRIVHPDDAQRFWDHARAHRQKITDLIELVKALTEAMTGVPTERRSDSPGGLTTTGPASTDVSSSEADSRAAAAWEKFKGRADLQDLILQSPRVY
jgi:hypothetical protein